MDLEIPNLFSESNGALSKLGVEREKERERWRGRERGSKSDAKTVRR